LYLFISASILEYLEDYVKMIECCHYTIWLKEVSNSTKEKLQRENKIILYD